MSSSKITDALQLPRPCICGSAVPKSYEQRLRIERQCLSQQTLYTIDSITVDVSGADYAIGDVLELYGGAPVHQPALLQVIALDGTGVGAVDVFSNTQYYSTDISAGTIDLYNINTPDVQAAGSGAHVMIDWQKVGVCCSCAPVPPAIRKRKEERLNNVS